MLTTYIHSGTQCIDSCNLMLLLSVLNLVAMSNYSMYIRLVCL
jgi:hypothetical protein